jgi:hypothetical protein
MGFEISTGLLGCDDVFLLSSSSRVDEDMVLID